MFMKFVKHMIKFHDRMMVKIICCLDMHSGLLAGICTKVKYTHSSHGSSICVCTCMQVHVLYLQKYLIKIFGATLKCPVSSEKGMGLM